MNQNACFWVDFRSVSSIPIQPLKPCLGIEESFVFLDQLPFLNLATFIMHPAHVSYFKRNHLVSEDCIILALLNLKMTHAGTHQPFLQCLFVYIYFVFGACYAIKKKHILIYNRQYKITKFQIPASEGCFRNTASWSIGKYFVLNQWFRART